MVALLLATALLHLEAARLAERHAVAAARRSPSEPPAAVHFSVPNESSASPAPALDSASVARLASTILTAPHQTQAHGGSYPDMDGGSVLRLAADSDRSLPPIPQEPTRLERTEVLLHAGDKGTLPPLHGLWSPAAAPQGVAIVVGGTSAGVAGPCRGTHRVSSRRHGLYNDLAAVLPASEGVSVLQFSYRIPGWRGVEQSRKDMSAAIQWVSARLPGVPIGLVGHSMGSAVVLSPDYDPLNAAGEDIVAVATLAGVSRQVTATISPSVELLVLHDPADSNVPVSSAWEIYSRHSGKGTAHKRLRYARYNTSKQEHGGDGSAPLLPRAAAHNFELGDACAQLVWPEMLRWVQRWKLQLRNNLR
eukprot:COSAG02_NODE_6404_length_3596_cov_8.406348_1_plen_363_part_00